MVTGAPEPAPPQAPLWLPAADAVSVQMLYASRYRHFIGHKVLAHCQRGQFWVGISRSELFDPEALADALTDGRIEEETLGAVTRRRAGDGGHGGV